VSKTGKFSTHHVPNEGIWFTPGEIVRLDESGRQVLIVKDPLGEYEVHSCRHATEYTGTPALLRVGLRRGPSPERTEKVSSFKPYGV
jgi:hypothetical protein